MEKNYYEFFSYNARTAERKLIYRGWCTEEEMKTLARGMALGFRQFRATCSIFVYLCREDGTTERIFQTTRIRISII